MHAMFSHFARLFRRQKSSHITHTRYGIMLDISTAQEQRSVCWYIKSPDLAAIVDGEIVMYERKEHAWVPFRRANAPSYAPGTREYAAMEQVMSEAAARMLLSKDRHA